MREARRRQILAAIQMKYKVSKIGRYYIYPADSVQKRAQEFTFLMMTWIFVKETAQPLYMLYDTSPDSYLDIDIYPDRVEINAVCHCDETGATDKIVEFSEKKIVVPASKLNDKLFKEIAAVILKHDKGEA